MHSAHIVQCMTCVLNVWHSLCDVYGASTLLLASATIDIVAFVLIGTQGYFHILIYMGIWLILNKSFLDLCVHQLLKFDNSLYIVHTKQFVLIIEFPKGCHLKMWCVCIVVPVLTVLDKNNSYEWVGSDTAMQLCHISRWQPAETSVIKTIAWRELYTENYHISAADIDTSWGKLLFKINIIGQSRFPLKYICWLAYFYLFPGTRRQQDYSLPHLFASQLMLV